jgi:hypothetical protein
MSLVNDNVLHGDPGIESHLHHDVPVGGTGSRSRLSADATEELAWRP